ncbi:hypothetical protein ABN028_20030 [Actinopolymorpha sp. B17G11]|uniref:hypothetical protein n=1 Tax=Actinopolymorpha sp. B17G11 TaxID=3160861 RepID=UPI0032E4A344
MGTVIEMDAPQREAKDEGVVVRYRGVTYQLPAELPADVFAPFLADELDLVGVMKAILGARADAEVAGEDMLQVLLARPNLPRGLVDAIRAGLEALFTANGDASQWQAFLDSKPSIPAYGRLIQGLVKEYGVSLGEAFASLGLSESGGATSKPTLPAGTKSTPAASGGTRRTKSS